MLRTARLAMFAVLGVMAASHVYAENKPAALVNGVAIPQERLDLRVKAVTAQTQGGQTDSPELRKAIRDDLINIEIMSQEAVKKGLDKQPEVEFAKQTLLSQAFVQDYMKSHPVSEKELTEEYDNQKKQTTGIHEYNFRHILVENEGEAKSIVAKLRKGGKEGKFEKLAESNSKDAGSRDKGGDLGWNIPTNMVKPLADALMNLTKGQISEPVQSQFGWHIIKLEDVRDFKLPPYEEVKPRLAQIVQQRVLQKLIADLRTKAKIE